MPEALPNPSAVPLASPTKGCQTPDNLCAVVLCLIPQPRYNYIRLQIATSLVLYKGKVMPEHGTPGYCWKCERVNPLCGFNPFKHKAQPDVVRDQYYCRDCEHGDGQATRNRRKYKSVEFPYKEWTALLERLGHACQMCGKVGRMTIDHIVPYSKGGELHISNLQPLCKSCNSRKKNRVD